ncbi:MAG: hypothetical protein ACREA8_04305 [Nitrosotalea sp.]
MTHIIATIEVKLIRTGKFSRGKVPNSVFNIIRNVETGIKNTKPNKFGSIASQISLKRVIFDPNLKDEVIVAKLIFSINESAKPVLDSLRANFKKELQRLGLYKITLQKTEYSR